MEEKILVSLGAGQSLQELAADLLALADDPHDVESSPRSGGFMVPETLAGRYALAAKASATTEEPQAGGAAKKASARTRRSRTPVADSAATTETKASAKTATAKTSKPRSRGKQTPASKGTAKGEAGVSDG